MIITVKYPKNEVKGYSFSLDIRPFISVTDIMEGSDFFGIAHFSIISDFSLSFLFPVLSLQGLSTPSRRSIIETTKLDSTVTSVNMKYSFCFHELNEVEFKINGRATL